MIYKIARHAPQPVIKAEVSKPQPAIKAEVPEADIWDLAYLTNSFNYMPLPDILILRNQIGDQIINNPQAYIDNIISVLKANPRNEKYRPYEEKLRKIKDLLQAF